MNNDDQIQDPTFDEPNDSSAINEPMSSDDEYIESSPVQEGSKSIFGNLSLREIIIRCLLLAAVLLFLLNVFWPKDSGSANKKKSVEVAKGPTGTDLITDPGEETDQLILEKVVQDYNEKELADAGHGKATVAPPTGVKTKPVKTIDERTNEILANSDLGLLALAQDESKSKPPGQKIGTGNKGKKAAKKDINPYVEKVRELHSFWDKGASAPMGVNLTIPEAVYAEAEGNEQIIAENVTTEESSRQILMEMGVEYLRVIPATLDLGYNSDTGGLMVLTVHHKSLEDVKFLADTSVGAYNERAAITLKKAVLADGRVINVDGVVVDQKDRIPSVSGKVDRHLLYNSVYGLGTSLLDSFAAFKQLDSGLVNSFSLFPPAPENQQTVDTDGLVVANGADALSRSIKESGNFRPNTLTTKPFMSVGVIFLP